MIWGHGKGEAVQQEFYAAVSSGEPGQVLALFQPELAEKVDAAVLALWMKAVTTNLGAFQDLAGSDFSINTRSEGGRSHIESEGTVHFERGEGRSKLHLVDGKVIAFFLRSEKLPEVWFTEAPETSGYAADGRTLLEALMTPDRVEEAYGRLHESVRAEASLEDVRGMLEGVRARVGALRDVTSTKHTFTAGGAPTLVLEYEVACENGVADGRVRYQFDPWKGRIVGFHVKPR
jgi:hypothetical protein